MYNSKFLSQRIDELVKKSVRIFSEFTNIDDDVPSVSNNSYINESSILENPINTINEN